MGHRVDLFNYVTYSFLVLCVKQYFLQRYYPGQGERQYPNATWPCFVALFTYEQNWVRSRFGTSGFKHLPPIAVMYKVGSNSHNYHFLKWHDIIIFLKWCKLVILIPYLFNLFQGFYRVKLEII